jgi:hypothetical protein
VVESRRKGQRITGDERNRIAADLVRDYGTGKSIRQLAADYDVSIGLARNLLIHGGVQFRSRGGSTRRTAPSA